MSAIKRGFSGNALKILAAVLMTVDHIGMILFPTAIWFRIIGRAAFPIFAYMIAEGCRYTRSRPRYLLTLVVAAIPFQLAVAVAEHSAYMCVLVTFACSVLLIILFERMVNERTAVWVCCFALALIGMAVGYGLGRSFGRSVGFDVDYGLVGVMLPLLIYLGRNRRERWFLTAVGLISLSHVYGGIQWWCLLALIPLAFYDGTRGQTRLKYGFYVYYPLHLAVLYGLSYIV